MSDKLPINGYGESKSRKISRKTNKEFAERRRIIDLRHYLKKIGSTMEQYYSTANSQNHRCAICDKPGEEEKVKRLCVDHDHSTGKFRGLLCNACNSGLGQFKDNVEFLTKAIEYLNDKTTQGSVGP